MLHLPDLEDRNGATNNQVSCVRAPTLMCTCGTTAFSREEGKEMKSQGKRRQEMKMKWGWGILAKGNWNSHLCCCSRSCVSSSCVVLRSSLAKIIISL